MKIIEFIGLPGSGKSTTLNKIKLYSHDYKKNSYTYKNFLINFYKKKIIKKLYFL
jgi:ABC-type lipoprotein export system ATPase subunit